MSEFKHIVDAKVASTSQFKAAKFTVVTAAGDAARALLIAAQDLPYVGPVAQLLNAVITICDNHKCNKEAFDLLRTRLYRFSQLLLGKGGLADIATERSQDKKLITFTKRMEDILNDAIICLSSFSKVGFFSSLLLGSKPQQQFNQLDADLTQCLNELSVVLQAVQLNEQAQTYQVVCDIQSKIESNGGLQGVYNDPARLQSFADEIGADVEDLKAEVNEVLIKLDHIKAELKQSNKNDEIAREKMDEINRNVQAILSVISSPSGKISSADLASFTLTSTPEIHYSKVLGQGTFGTVYEGSYNNELVAVKVISTTTAAGLTPAQLNELSKEVLMHSKVCNSPGVVRLYGANLTAEPRCVVLELADGSLYDVLHKNRPSIDLSMTSKLSLAVQVSSAMACISSLDLVHRDIKSSNVLIFLQSQGRVAAKLADFGLAKIDTENTYATSQTPKGTPPYMAPELFKGEYSSASDVYAFAIMLNEMLLREVPFPSVTLPEIIMRVGTYKARPQAFTTTPSDRVGCRLMSLISSCWNQDPQLRMTFRALANELSQLLAASVEIARNGTNRPVSGNKGEPTTPLSPQSPETAISTLAEWLTSSCSLLPCESTSLAHTLVTIKCITSVAALSEVLHHRPDLLSQDLKIAEAYNLQIKKALNQTIAEVALKDLSIELVCLLLDHHNLHSIKNVVVENEISGTILAASVDTVEDLKEIGIKPMQAKALFKLIEEWKEQGLPVDFLRALRSLKSSTKSEDRKAGQEKVASPGSVSSSSAAPTATPSDSKSRGIPASPASDIATDWVEYLDARSKRMYYHSTALKKSTWVKPDRFVPHSEDAEDHSTEETAVTAVAEQRTLSESVVTVGEEWRVVLSWSQHPKNLDLYCITNFKPRLIYSGESNVGGRNNANKGNIELDISVQNGFGPETITFTPNPAKKYRFIVYNVTGNTFSSLADSGAMMNLMKGSGGPVKFHIPTDVVLDDCGECARFWHVFDLFRGVITPVNRIISKDLRDVPGGKILATCVAVAAGTVTFSLEDLYFPTYTHYLVTKYRKAVGF